MIRAKSWNLALASGLMFAGLAGLFVEQGRPPAREHPRGHPCHAPEYERSRWWAEIDSLGSGIGAIRGSVYSETGRLIVGALVWIEDSGRGTLTPPQGHFTLDSIPAGEHLLNVDLIGYGAQRHEVAVATGRTDTLCFVLREIFVDLPEMGSGLVEPGSDGFRRMGRHPMARDTGQR